jgi:hypothetical protein
MLKLNRSNGKKEMKNETKILFIIGKSADVETIAGLLAGKNLETNSAVLLNYNFYDRQDEDGEAYKFGIYSMINELKYSRLADLALCKKEGNAALIAVDWRRPWEFLQELQSSFKILENALMNEKSEFDKVSCAESIFWLIKLKNTCGNFKIR